VRKDSITRMEAEEAIRLRKQGMPIKEISEKIGRAYSSTHKLLRKNKETANINLNSWPDWSEQELSTLCNMKENGYSWNEISLVLDRTQEACKFRYRKVIQQHKNIKEYNVGDEFTTEEGRGPFRVVKIYNDKNTRYLCEHTGIGYKEMFFPDQTA